MAGAVLTWHERRQCEGGPEVRSAADYQAMSQSQMSSITGENRVRTKIRNTNANITATTRLPACGGGRIPLCTGRDIYVHLCDCVAEREYVVSVRRKLAGYASESR